MRAQRKSCLPRPPITCETSAPSSSSTAPSSALTSAPTPMSYSGPTPANVPNAKRKAIKPAMSPMLAPSVNPRGVARCVAIASMPSQPRTLPIATPMPIPPAKAKRPIPCKDCANVKAEPPNIPIIRPSDMPVSAPSATPSRGVRRMMLAKSVTTASAPTNAPINVAPVRSDCKTSTLGRPSSIDPPTWQRHEHSLSAKGMTQAYDDLFPACSISNYAGFRRQEG